MCSWSRKKAHQRHMHVQGGAKVLPINLDRGQKEKQLLQGTGVTFRSHKRSTIKREEQHDQSQKREWVWQQEEQICHSEGDEECALITPCKCTGSLRFVHQSCLNQWIKSSDTHCCELCKYEFLMEAHLKPLRRWEKLQMSSSERRKIFCSVTFHLVPVACVIWSLYILINRTAEEIRQGKNNGILEWPFWTKLTVVALSFAGGLIFMYIQCKVYLQLWRRLKAFNRVIFVQNCPDNVCHVGDTVLPAPGAYGIPEQSVFPAPQTQTGASCPAPPGCAEIAPV
ncbi:hypothetical protein P4O66_012505 [Electrophorus voltai]|uniref:RING-CH-type domain-containing protein n=1 Tax=Electrophorus voltai TaxID=2609070 RepID=A0AAD9DTF4_9TELE|nr:hypothetical protein P4O66_012505 [Electrophorus voltai]